MEINIKELKERYEELHPNNGINGEQLDKIKKILNVDLPRDFCEISTFFSGGYLGGISNYWFDCIDNSTNIIDETIRLRTSVELPTRFIVLAEPPESLIAMDTINSPSIIWFDAVEVSELNNKSFTIKADEWSTYADFFKKLIEDEEDENDEDE